MEIPLTYVFQFERSRLASVSSIRRRCHRIFITIETGCISSKLSFIEK